MQNVICKAMLLLASIYPGFHLMSQISLSPQVVSAGGNDFQNAQFQLTYTIGEMSAVSTLSAGNAIATQGFNQPDKFTVAFVDGPDAWGNGIALFPNPAVNNVLIQFEEGLNSHFRIEITDQAGRLICPARYFNSASSSENVSIQVNQLAAGIYLANICEIAGVGCKTIRFTKLP
jgi:hypothetical protein